MSSGLGCLLAVCEHMGPGLSELQASQEKLLARFKNLLASVLELLVRLCLMAQLPISETSEGSCGSAASEDFCLESA